MIVTQLDTGVRFKPHAVRSDDAVHPILGSRRSVRLLGLGQGDRHSQFFVCMAHWEPGHLPTGIQMTSKAPLRCLLPLSYRPACSTAASSSFPAAGSSLASSLKFRRSIAARLATLLEL